MLLCLHYSIVSYFVSVMMYYYNASTAEIAFSVLQVLYEFVVVVAYSCDIICNDLGVEAYKFYTSYLPLFKTV